MSPPPNILDWDYTDAESRSMSFKGSRRTLLMASLIRYRWFTQQEY